MGPRHPGHPARGRRPDGSPGVLPRGRLGRASGGLAQRLCLGRALVLAPRLLVLDEPFSALDGPLAGALRGLLATEQARGSALLLATHDLPAVADLCDHLLVLEGGRPRAQGQLQALITDGPPVVRRLWNASPRLPLA